MRTKQNKTKPNKKQTNQPAPNPKKTQTRTTGFNLVLI